MSPVTEAAPPYVHRILDAFLRNKPLDFEGEPVPADVQERLEAWFASQHKLEAEREVDFTDSHMALVARVAYAVSTEFERSLGIQLGANRDDTWLKAGDGIVSKIGLTHVGWYHEEGERAHMFVRADLYPVPPDDGRDWHAVYAIA
jgi:hypothetical protein